jgi:hypothetical protein
MDPAVVSLFGKKGILSGGEMVSVNEKERERERWGRVGHRQGLKGGRG